MVLGPALVAAASVTTVFATLALWTSLRARAMSAAVR